jgi:predicted nucleotidyltransferase
LLETHVDTIQERTAGLLREGVNYPLARARVVAELVGEAALTEVMHAPNNILGIEYLLAANRLGSIEGQTIQRIGAGYHDEQAVGTIASATGIRRMLAVQEDVDALIPDRCMAHLSAAVEQGRNHDPAATFRLLAARLLDDRVALREIYLVADGIDRRLVEAAAICCDLEGLVDAIKSRQLTRTRVQRMLMHVLVGSHAEEVDRSLVAGPRYLHLLGASAKGREFLNRSRKLRELPLVSNYSRIQNVLKRRYGIDSHDYQIALEQLRVEERCSAIYTLLMRTWCGDDRRRDYFEAVRGCPT